MRALRRSVGLAVVALILGPAAVFAQGNVSSADPVHLVIGQSPVAFSLGAAPATQRWFDIRTRSGRSYCVEATGSEYPIEDNGVDPRVAVYRQDAATVIASNDNVDTEPDGRYMARACWIDTYGSTANYEVIKVDPAIALGIARYFQIRIVETTLWSSWFFHGGDYNAFVLLRNTTSSTVNFTITWRSAEGAVAGAFNGSVAGNNGLGVNSKTYVADPATYPNGTVEIAHDGSPDALVGQTTSLSATTGVGFDAPFFQRKPW